MKRKMIIPIMISAAALSLSACDMGSQIKIDVDPIVIQSNEPDAPTEAPGTENDPTAEPETPENEPETAKKEWVMTKMTGYDGDGVLEWVEEFDSNGNVLKDMQYDEDGNVIYCSMVGYDDEGNQTKLFVYRNGILITKNDYIFDEKGHKIYMQEEYYHDDGSCYSRYEAEEDKDDPNKIILSHYDEDGNVNFWREIIRDSDGAVTIVYTYDENDELTSEEWYYPNGGTVEKRTEYDDYSSAITVYEYDEKGREVSYTEYAMDDENTVLFWATYEYTDDNGSEKYRSLYSDFNTICDSEGRVVRFEALDKDGNVTVTSIMEYNEDGIKIYDETVDADGSVTICVDNEYEDENTLNVYYYIDEFNGGDQLVLEYDDYGNLIRQTTIHSDKKTEYSEYKYDEYNNRIEVEMYDEKGELFMREEIEYELK